MTMPDDSQPTASRAKPVADRVLLESKQRFSQSLLWALERNYYQRTGIEAWSANAVPHYITNNPFIAEAYARVLFGWLRDWANTPGGIDPTEPIYMVELGTGTGRLAFQLMTLFFQLLDASPLRHLKVKYIMTDFVGQNRAFWKSHPSFQPFIAAGRLDFADFDAEHSDQPLVLGLSGLTLTAENVKNPVAALANYFFNVLPSDLFHIQNGVAYESLATLYSTQPEPDLSDPGVFKRLDVVYQDSSAPISTEHYTDPDFNKALTEYAADLNDTMLLYPMLALQTMRQFNALSKGRLLLLIAEKGHERLSDLADHGSPGIAVQGGFSLMVNLHALAKYANQLGGIVLHPAHRSIALDVVAYLTGQPAGGYFDTTLAYQSAIEQYGPDDLFLLKKFIEAHYTELTLEQMLSYMRQSEWDGYVFLRCFSSFIQKLQHYAAPLREDIHNMVLNVWARYFHIGEQQDLPFALATVLHLTDYYDEAIELFNESLAMYGPDPNTFYNLASCYYQLNDPAQALGYLNQTLALDPDFASALAMREQIEIDLGTASS